MSATVCVQIKQTKRSEQCRARNPFSKDDGLALFHDMEARENRSFLHPSTAEDIENSLSTKPEALLDFQISVSPTAVTRKTNDLLSATEWDKTDYDWLLTPPGTPLFPSLHTESLRSYSSSQITDRESLKGTKFSGSNATKIQRMSRERYDPQTPINEASSTGSLYTFPKACSPPCRGGNSPSRGSYSPVRARSNSTSRLSPPAKTLNRCISTLNRDSTVSPRILQRANTSRSISSLATDGKASSRRERNPISPKLQPWNTFELEFSADPPPNLRTSIAEKPLSSFRTGMRRPRIGPQDARDHKEARHTKSEINDCERSHWQNTSCFASKLSRNSQDQSGNRWSSRRSIINSSDDVKQAREPTFLDINAANSPSSTSLTSKIVARRFNHEVSKKCSPTESWKRRSTNSFTETANFCVSARKSFQPIVQHADHSDVSRKICQPFLSSASTTSFYNVDHTMVRPGILAALAESTMTASSNASSEKGMKIFPSNESSDEEQELDSPCPQNMSIEFSPDKIVSNAMDPLCEEYNRMDEYKDMQDQENVAKGACRMSGHETDTNKYLITKAWGGSQMSRETEPKEEEQGCFVPTDLFERIMDEGIPHSNIQETNNEENIKGNQETKIKHTAKLHCDIHDISCHEEQVTAGSLDQTLNCDQLCTLDSGSSQEAAEVCRFEKIISSFETVGSGKCYTEICSRMRHPSLHYMKSSSVDPSEFCHEENGVCSDSDSPRIFQNTFLEKNKKSLLEGDAQKGLLQDNCSTNKKQAPVTDEHSTDTKASWRQGLTKIDLLDETLKYRKQNLVMHMQSLGEAFTLNTNPASCGKNIAHLTAQAVGIQDWAQIAQDCIPDSSDNSLIVNDMLRPVGRADNIQQKSSNRGYQQFSTEVESQALQNFPTTPRFDMSSNLHLLQLTPDTNSSESEIHTVETTQLIGLSNLIQPEKYDLVEDNKAVILQKYDHINQVNYYEIGGTCSSLYSGTTDINLSSSDGYNQPSSMMEEDRSENSQRLSGIALVSPSWAKNPSNQSPSNEHEDSSHLEPSILVSRKNMLGESDSQNNQKGEIQDSIDPEISSCIQNVPQCPDKFQSQSNSELRLGQTALLEAKAASATTTESRATQTEAIQVILTNQTTGQSQPQQDLPQETRTGPEQRTLTCHFSLEETTNTILLCSSIVHEMVYKASSIAAAKEAEALEKEAFSFHSREGGNANAVSTSSFRAKVSKFGIWKMKQNEPMTTVENLQEDQSLEATSKVAKHLIPIAGKNRNPTICKAYNHPPDMSKEKGSTIMTMDPHCKCTIM
ncbi:hypothetical protein KP509_18G065000 [Ceratopteris richardii]|uniref:Uncharacterized protein n=2 Tax=Ceratopteris richardii TaxID=49495 RepID=A0A8T2STM8_CERRI|nr:hypothetical protein KP509_18G065000 [Ceratopteris richardii]